MLKLEQLAQICDGLAWADGVIPYKTEDYAVNVFLPFPFFDAIQNEIRAMAISEQVIPGTENPVPFDRSMIFMDIHLPNGIMIHLKPSEGQILIERTPKGKVVEMKKFLSPNGGANQRA